MTFYTLILRSALDQELLYFCSVSICNVVVDNVYGFGILMWKTIRATIFLKFFSLFFFAKQNWNVTLDGCSDLCFLKSVLSIPGWHRLVFGFQPCSWLLRRGRGFLRGAAVVSGLSRCLVMKCLSCLPPLQSPNEFPRVQRGGIK